MNAVDDILEGLEAELALERELGARSVAFDRSLLVAPAPPRTVEPPLVQSPGRAKSSDQTIRQPGDQTIPDFVFLHDRALSPGGVEMMAKIVAALGKTAETAPVVICPPLPRAKVFVVLGARALRKYYPGLRGEPGQWLTTGAGASVLVTYSPEYILRYGSAETPELKRIKAAMWTSLKGVLRRLQV